MSDNLFSRLRKRFDRPIASAKDDPAPPFKTERLQLWRSQDLKPTFSETLDKIEENYRVQYQQAPFSIAFTSRNFKESGKQL